MIQPIVEGEGDVEAFPILLRRLVRSLGIVGISVGKPIRLKTDQLVKHDGFCKALSLARIKGASAIIVVFDLDSDCARQYVGDMSTWAGEIHTGLPFASVMARKEYEAWFLASIESLRGKRGIRSNAAISFDPESRRSAKDEIKKLLKRGRFYSESADQAALSALMNLAEAYSGASSFRKLVKELVRILNTLGYQPNIPVEWTSN